MRTHWSVQPATYLYWDRKEHFLLEHDTYPVWTIFAVEQGQFAYRFGGHEGEGGFGDLIVCPPGTAFHRRTLTALTFHFIQFTWEEEGEPEEDALLAGKWTVRDVERLRSTYRYLRSIGRGMQGEPALGRVKHMTEDLWRLLEIEHNRAAQDKLTEGKHPGPQMQQARQWLEDHGCTASMSMSHLARLLDLTPVQLTRQFRSAYGTTPSEFVTGLRLKRACRLLEDSTQSIDLIAQQCGYENGFYLSRVFTAKLGITPSQYRRQHRL